MNIHDRFKLLFKMTTFIIKMARVLAIIVTLISIVVLGLSALFSSEGLEMFEVFIFVLAPILFWAGYYFFLCFFHPRLNKIYKDYINKADK